MEPGTAQVSTVTIPTPAHLLSLPRELRDAIYELCLLDLRVIGMRTGQHPQWLLTCRQVFDEAAPMVYEQCCIYRAIDWRCDSHILDELRWGFRASFPWCAPWVAVKQFDKAKRIISYVALDVHLDMTMEHMNWLSRDYLAQISDLSDLKALFISLNLRPGVERNKFKQQLARSDLRIFELVSFIQPVESLLKRVPKSCQVHWVVPESIRRAANRGSDYDESNFLYMTEFMREVQHAVTVTERQEVAAEV